MVVVYHMYTDLRFINNNNKKINMHKYDITCMYVSMIYINDF